MTEYHVGCGVFAIYAGTLNKKKTMWQNKSDVTHEAIDAVAEYLLIGKKELHFEHKGKRYVMRVVEEGEQE